jgi:hypothetical protein
MQLVALASIAFAAVVSAQDSSSSTAALVSSVPYSNDATTLLTQTNSLGVITGQPSQPAVVTSQPAGITTQPPVALIPAGFGDGTTTATFGNQTYTIAVSGNVTSLVTRTPTPTAQTSVDTSGTGAAASGSGSAASASSTGNAGAGLHFKAGGAALAAAGGFFAFFM